MHKMYSNTFALLLAAFPSLSNSKPIFAITPLEPSLYYSTVSAVTYTLAGGSSVVTDGPTVVSYTTFIPELPSAGPSTTSSLGLDQLLTSSSTSTSTSTSISTSPPTSSIPTTTSSISSYSQASSSTVSVGNSLSASSFQIVTSSTTSQYQWPPTSSSGSSSSTMSIFPQTYSSVPSSGSSSVTSSSLYAPSFPQSSFTNRYVPPAKSTAPTAITSSSLSSSYSTASYQTFSSPYSSSQLSTSTPTTSNTLSVSYSIPTASTSATVSVFPTYNYPSRTSLSQSYSSPKYVPLPYVPTSQQNQGIETTTDTTPITVIVTVSPELVTTSSTTTLTTTLSITTIQSVTAVLTYSSPTSSSLTYSPSYTYSREFSFVNTESSSLTTITITPPTLAQVTTSTAAITTPQASDFAMRVGGSSIQSSSSQVAAAFSEQELSTSPSFTPSANTRLQIVTPAAVTSSETPHPTPQIADQQTSTLPNIIVPIQPSGFVTVTTTVTAPKETVTTTVYSCSR